MKWFKILLRIVGIHYEYTCERTSASSYSFKETKTVRTQMSQGKIQIKVDGNLVWEGDSASVSASAEKTTKPNVNIGGGTYSNLNQVVINGRVVTSDITSSPAINVEINGDVNGDVDGFTSVKVSGNVTGNVDAGTDLICGDVGGSARSGTNLRAKNVQGDVRSGTDVSCNDVTGNVDAGMSVDCGKVQGKVKAGMNVNIR